MQDINITDFRIGFIYEQYEMDKNRYLNQGMVWTKKTYGLTSPRLHKIQKLINDKKVRNIQENDIDIDGNDFENEYNRMLLPI
jgi:hypothetical protein